MTTSDQRRYPAMSHFAARSALLCFTLLVLLYLPAPAQDRPAAPAQADLPYTLAALDAALFDSFNRCDLEKFASFFADDVEFYHDKGGLTRSRHSLVESIRNNICGKVRREAITASFESHPIPGYGAVQMGVHRLYESNAKQGGGLVGSAKFIHLWQHKEGVWRIARVISYDHGPAAK